MDCHRTTRLLVGNSCNEADESIDEICPNGLGQDSFELAGGLGCAIDVHCAIPSREQAQGWIQPVSMQGLYAPQNAKLEGIYKFPGERVEFGDVVFQLNDQASQLRRIEFLRQKDSADIKLKMS